MASKCKIDHGESESETASGPGGLEEMTPTKGKGVGGVTVGDDN